MLNLKQETIKIVKVCKYINAIYLQILDTCKRKNVQRLHRHALLLDTIRFVFAPVIGYSPPDWITLLIGRAPELAPLSYFQKKIVFRFWW